jgi:DNA/RNA endonuclease G (NUC1)
VHTPRVVAFLALAIIGFAGPARAQDNDAINPRTCRDIWQGVGLPAVNSGASDHITTICHLGYITGHNNGKKTPDWVIERLKPGLVTGDGTREDQDFKPDGALRDKPTARDADYEGSGYDKGHQAPAADFKGNQEFLDDTFVFSNAVPQVGIGFNRSIWRSFETHVRKLVTGDRPDLYVITGPIPQGPERIKITRNSDVCRLDLELAEPDRRSICPENRSNKRIECAAGVAVPAAMFKIVYDPGMQSAFAVVMQNLNHTGKYPSGRNFEYIQAHRVGIGTIEKLTGHTFLTALPARKQRQLKASCTSVKFR